jgi:hypothetical protein
MFDSDNGNSDSSPTSPIFASPTVQVLHMYIFIWGIASLVTAALSPGLIATLPVVGSIPTAASALLMVVGGHVFLSARLLRSILLLLVVLLWGIVMMIGSFTTAVQWAVPYNTGLAAISMTIAHLVLVVALLHNTAVYVGPPEYLEAELLPDQ